MKDARKIRVTQARASDTKPGQVNQLEVDIGEVVALMPGDKLMVRFDPSKKTFTGLYVSNK